MNSSRRRFLSAMSLATVCPTTMKSEPGRWSSNVLQVGVIGTGVRGKYLIGNLPESVRVAAICDCSTTRIANTLQPTGLFTPVLQRFKEQDAAKCETYQDYRLMLDREKLDAVIIATPDHHHSLAATLAMQAGMHVYLEKPLSVCVREGRYLVDMVKRTGRVLQVGSQQRSMEVNRFGCELIRNRALGKISRVELPCYPGPIGSAIYEEENPIDGIDWDLFCGPTPLRPHHRNLWIKDDFRIGPLLWRGWDLFREYSGHLMTNWGAHSIDMVQLALGRDDSGPIEVRANPVASIADMASLWQEKSPGPVGDASDRRYWPVTMKYADGVELQFIRGPDAVIFHGERGRMMMKRNFFETDPPGLVPQGPDVSVLEKWKGEGNVARPHLENWIDAIRSSTLLNSPVESGHRTATICHLANLARELNQTLHWNPTRETLADNDPMNVHLNRPRRKGFEFPQI